MSHSGLFGTACKTCRRLGRKCDRTRPACMRCDQRGVVCEGYVFRWVGIGAGEPLAVPVDSGTNTSFTYNANPRTKRRPSRSRMTKIDNDITSSTCSLAESATVARQPQSDHPRIFEDIQDEGTISQAETKLKEKDRQIVMTLTSSKLDPQTKMSSPNDNLGPLIKYC
jgi:Fungal Zn(2)-Cys(6) binuclear cluster domain